jgi:hypothetical protein
MGQRAGYISGVVGGAKVHLAHSGFVFAPGPEAERRWRGWWGIVRADQWGVFFAGAILGMTLPAMIYVSFLARGTDIQGLGISAALASSVSARAGAWIGGAIALLGAWTLFKTQLDNLEGMVRSITDILWTGSRRIRAWRGGDVRAVLLGARRHHLLGIDRAAAGAADRLAQVERQRGGRGVRGRRHARPLREHAAAAAARTSAALAPLRAGGDGGVLHVLRQPLAARRVLLTRS